MWGAVKAQMQSPPSQLNKKVPAHASGPQSHVQITHRSFTLVSAENYHVKKRKRERKISATIHKSQQHIPLPIGRGKVVSCDSQQTYPLQAVSPARWIMAVSVIRPCWR
jgi:hypothetical protein